MLQLRPLLLFCEYGYRVCIIITDWLAKKNDLVIQLENAVVICNQSEMLLFGSLQPFFPVV